MYPYWLEIGGFQLPTFGPMVVLGFLSAHFFIAKELLRKGIDKELAASILTTGIVAGLLGSKLYFVLFELPPGATWGDTFGAVFSGSGLTWHGGFALAMAAIIWVIRRRGAPVRAVADAVGIGLALGYGIGRIGCQLAGDGDYGVATDLPWGMAYPDGVVPTFETVHPAPVYETLMSLVIFVLLWLTRKRLTVPGMSFCFYLVLSGAARFAVEFIRLNPEVAFGLTGAQLISVALIAIGAIGPVYLMKSQPAVRLDG